jgi:hypothetical protein
MGTAPPVRLRSTNTSKTKRSASFAGQVAMGIVQPAPLASTATVTGATSASGADPRRQDIDQPVQARFTRNERE